MTVEPNTIDVLSTRATELLSQLVAIPSPNDNPQQAREIRCEQAMADYVSQRLADIGMAIDMPLLDEGRPSVIGHWPGSNGGPTLALEAHMDTVGVANMSIDPFDPIVRDGRMYGRGSCDTKASLAVFLACLEHMADLRDRLKVSLMCIAAAGEEGGCLGAKKLVADGLRVDRVVVGEPTLCEVVVAHKGAAWAHLLTKGRSCHASMPESGRNAILGMGLAADYVCNQWSRRLAEMVHPLLGSATVACTQIDGGTKENIIPAECRACFDMRLLPQHDCEQLVQELVAELSEVVGVHCDIELESLQANGGLEARMDGELVQGMLAARTTVLGQGEPRGVTYFADSGPFASVGSDVVVFGPGSIAQAHTADEYIELEQIRQATAIMLEFLYRQCAS